MQKDNQDIQKASITDRYLAALTSQIRNRHARIMVRQEMAGHLEDQTAAYLEEGMAREEAEKKAVAQMGDPVSVGMDMDRIHRPRAGWNLILPILFLSILGLWAQYFFYYRFSDALLESEYFFGIPQYIFLRQCLITLAGLALMAVVYFLDYSIIAAYSQILGLAFLLGITILCQPGMLPRVNGAHSYMKSVLYLFVPIYGGILSRYRGAGLPGAVICLFWMAAAFFTGIWQVGGGFGISFDMLTICYVLFLLAVIRGWFTRQKKLLLFSASLMAPIAAACLGIHSLASYQLARIQVLLHPEPFAREEGYLVTIARTITSSLPLFASNYRTLMEKGQLPMQKLPNVQQEYIMLQIASIGGLALVFLFVLLLSCFYLYLARMIFHQKNQAGQVMGLGCVLVLSFETIRSLCNCFGFYTMSTGGLPFFSYGKYHTITVYILFGVLLSIYRYQDLAWDRSLKKMFRNPA